MRSRGAPAASWTAGTPPAAGVSAAVLTAGLVAVLVARFDVWPLVGAALLCGALAVFWIHPALAMVAAAFLLYANLPSALRASIPEATLVSGAFAVPLAIPTLRAFAEGRRLIVDRMSVLLVVYFGVLLVSARGARSPEVAAESLLQFATEGLILYWLVLQGVRSLAALRALVWAAALTAALLATLSVAQAVSGNYAQQFGGLAQRDLVREGTQRGPRWNGGTLVRLSERAAGPIGDPNRYAQILLVALPWALFVQSTTRSAAQRALARGAAVAIGAGVLSTYSRGAFVTVGLLSLLAAAWGLIRPRVLVITALALTAAISIAAPGVLARAASIAGITGLLDRTSVATADGAIRGRATEMLAAVMALRDHPVLGVGPGQYVPFYSQRYQQLEDVKFRELTAPRESHNLFLSVGVESGLLGLTVFLSLLLVAIRGLMRARSVHHPELAHLATAMLFSLAAYLAAGLFLHLSFERYLWLLLACAGATIRIAAVSRQGAGRWA